jgi:hypothetical protein
MVNQQKNNDICINFMGRTKTKLFLKRKKVPFRKLRIQDFIAPLHVLRSWLPGLPTGARSYIFTSPGTCMC